MAKKSILDKYIDDIINDELKKSEKYIHKCLVKTNQEMLHEVNSIYKSLIHDFYLYQTSSYIRHWEGIPGTKHGENLYNGNNFYINNKHEPKLYVEFSSQKMDGGYALDEPQHVLDCVLNGIRFPFTVTESYYDESQKKHITKISKEPMWIEQNSLNYSSKYFSYSGNSINKAFKKFDKEWDRISEQCFYSYWDDFYNELLKEG